MTKSKILNEHYPIFENSSAFSPLNKENTVMNFNFAPSETMTNAFGELLFGCYYIQNDYLIEQESYVEKFLLVENEDENYTELKITCGPYATKDYEKQKILLEHWANTVKKLATQ